MALSALSSESEMLGKSAAVLPAAAEAAEAAPVVVEVEVWEGEAGAESDSEGDLVKTFHAFLRGAVHVSGVLACLGMS